MRALVSGLKRNGVREENIFTVDFPTTLTAPGRLLRKIFAGEGEETANQRTIIYLFLADLAEIQPIISKHLASGSYVIAGRHPFVSGFIYQADAVSQIQISTMQQRSLFLQPDRIFVVDLPTSEYAKRMAQRKDIHAPAFEQVELIQIETYRTRYVQYAFDHKDTVLLDGTQSTDDILDVVLTEVLRGDSERSDWRNHDPS